jgi:hypothetical protein
MPLREALTEAGRVPLRHIIMIFSEWRVALRARLARTLRAIRRTPHRFGSRGQIVPSNNCLRPICPLERRAAAAECVSEEFAVVRV